MTYTLKEAAIELHLSERQVRRLIDSGDLETQGEPPDRLITQLGINHAKYQPRPSFPRKEAAIPTILAGIYARWPDPAKWPENPPWRWELAKIQDEVADDVPEILASTPTDGPWESGYWARVRYMYQAEIEAGRSLLFYDSAEQLGLWRFEKLPPMVVAEEEEEDEEDDFGL